MFVLGPRTKRPKKPPGEKSAAANDEKRPRTAFSGPQLARLKVSHPSSPHLSSISSSLAVFGS